MTTLPTSTDVLIVGAGPTGMALAIALRQAGVNHLIIDKLPKGENTSRAAVIHAHTLEMLESLGVAKDLIARGLKLSAFCIRDRDRALVQLSFDTLPSEYHYLLMLPQDETETVLNERLTTLGGQVHRGVSATAIEQDADGARVTLASATGETVVKARYVVGGDGMHSVVRKEAGIEFEGSQYAESFMLADVHMAWSLGTSEVSLFFSPAGLLVVAPLPNGTFRIVAIVDNAPEHPTVADIQALIDTRGPQAGRNAVKNVVWGSRFRIHHRVAKTYRRGRMLVMGDAAHVHSPAGGQGMNTGLVDAVFLGRLLADVVQGKRPESALDSYESQRRPAASRVLGLAGMLTGMAVMKSRVKRALRNTILSIVNHLWPAKRRLVMNLSGLSRKQLAVLPG
jgi:2-polyprenyl-6-methoxyphenol hydroxylase-like FAD-dependent oxidoreductase